MTKMVEETLPRYRLILDDDTEMQFQWYEKVWGSPNLENLERFLTRYGWRSRVDTAKIIHQFTGETMAEIAINGPLKI